MRSHIFPQRGLVGEIIARFEKRGYKLVAIKVIQPTEAFAKQHYADLSQKPFFPNLVKYFSSGPVIAMVAILTHLFWRLWMKLGLGGQECYRRWP